MTAHGALEGARAPARAVEGDTPKGDHHRTAALEDSPDTEDPTTAQLVDATRVHIARDALALGETWIRARLMGNENAEDALDQYLDEQGELGRAIEDGVASQVLRPWGRGYRRANPDEILRCWQERHDEDPGSIHDAVWYRINHIARATLERRAKGEPEPHPTQYAEATRKRRLAATKARSDRLYGLISAGAEDIGAALIAHDADPSRYPAPSAAAWLANTVTAAAADEAIAKHVTPWLVAEEHRWGLDDLTTNANRDRARDNALANALDRWRVHYEKAAERIVQTIHQAVWPSYRDAPEHDFLPDQRTDTEAEPGGRRRRRLTERRTGPGPSGPENR